MADRYVYLITILEFVLLVAILISVLLPKEPIKVSCDCDIKCPEVKCPISCNITNIIYNMTYPTWTSWTEQPWITWYNYTLWNSSNCPITYGV